MFTSLKWDEWGEERERERDVGLLTASRRFVAQHATSVERAALRDKESGDLDEPSTENWNEEDGDEEYQHDAHGSTVHLVEFRQRDEDEAACGFLLFSFALLFRPSPASFRSVCVPAFGLFAPSLFARPHSTTWEGLRGQKDVS